jgi:alpha-galactosidase
MGFGWLSVNESVDRLMTDIMSRLRKINPDIMIEFRQPYIGPLMRKYGNMFRAADCPNMEVVNRVRTTDLRILSGNTAVHSDMFRWHAEDPVESAALQILNILFSVPQLSVKLDSIPDEHYQMAKFWINYWKKNRDILLDGKFIPVNPGGLYPVLMAKGSDKLIAAVYEDHFMTIEDPLVRNMDIVNAKGTETIILDLENPFGKVEIKIYDCMGNVVKEDLIRLKKGIHKFNVPPSGLLSIILPLTS